MSLKYRHSSKTKAAWEALNPVIVADEIVIEKDTKRLKVGDGVSTYNSLIYINNPAKYNVKLYKPDIIWVDGYVKITSPEVFVNGKQVIVTNAILRVGAGDVNIDAVVSYPRRETWNGSIENAFYIKDANNRLTKLVDFEFLELSYDLIPKKVGTYDNYDLRNPIGENVIHEENSGNSWHSGACKRAFMAAFPEITSFGNEVIESISDPLTNFGSVDYRFEPKYSELKKANLYTKPYVGAANNEDYASNPEILKIGSHYNNPFERHDVTLNSTTFFDNSIAVGACNDSEVIDPTTGTSYGYGMEFFEDFRTWSIEYPETIWVGLGTSKYGTLSKDVTGKILTIVPSAAEYAFPNLRDFAVGSTVRIGTSTTDAGLYTETTVASIDSDTQVTVVDAIASFPEGSIFWYHASPAADWRANKFLDYPTNTVNASHQQSPVCAVIGAKMKKVKLYSGANWQVVREACRATAKKTVGGVFGVNAWDMYRGFGIIQVVDAIAYIEANYKSVDYKKKLAEMHEAANYIHPFIEYSDLKDNSPVAKRMIDELILRIEALEAL